MENRARNESAFNKLLVEIEKRSSHFEGGVSDLRKHYENTNPFYLFSNQFHELILKLLAQLENDKNVDVRKCVKELIQELTFYKIACPLKHLRLADSNIPNLFTTLRAKSWPDDIHQKTSEKRASFPGISETKNSTEMIKTFHIDDDGVAPESLAPHGFVPDCKEPEPSNSRLFDCKTSPSDRAKSIEDALKSIPKGATTVINIKIGQQSKPLPAVDRPPPSKTASSPDRDGDSVSKRKIGEIMTLKEEEISRKKTSNGQNLVRIRKPVLEKIAPLKEPSNGVKETIYIIDDDDDDVIVKSSSIPSPKPAESRRVFLTATASSTGIARQVTANPAPPQKVKVPKVIPDDDVFIVEELNAIPLRRDLPTAKKAPTLILPKPSRESTDDIVIVDSYKTKPAICRDASTVGRLKSEVDGDVCIVSYSR